MKDKHPPSESGSHPRTGRIDDGLTDPVAYAERTGIGLQHRRFNHDTTDYPEAGSAGLAIVGVTDDTGALLLLVHPRDDHVVLPHAPVAYDGDWAATAREHVDELTGIRIALDVVTRVRRVDHLVSGETDPKETTHHVVFGGSVAEPDPPTPTLCSDNEWQIGWYEEPPVDLAAAPDAEGEDTAYNDVRLFLD